VVKARLLVAVSPDVDGSVPEFEGHATPAGCIAVRQ